LLAGAFFGFGLCFNVSLNFSSSLESDMRSPLEHEPELIEGIGLITARWAALERELAQLLGVLMIQSTAGERIYYSVGNFSQRIEIVQAGVRTSMGDNPHYAIAEALFTKIRRLWKARNYLVHSHYVYAINYEGGGHSMYTAENPTALGPHPDTRPSHPIRMKDSRTGEFLDESPVTSRGFAYEKRKQDGTTEIVPVNKGTFIAHANQLIKRGRQISRLKRAIETLQTRLIASHSALVLTSPYKRLEPPPQQGRRYRAHRER
jgi:hypothetical protein